MQLSGRTVLLTGAKRIGAAIAMDVARLGADVAVCYWDSRDEAMRTVEDVQACGRRALAIQADLRCPNASATVVDQVISEFGRLDVLIAMASRYVKAAFDEIDERTWATNIAVDLSAQFFCAQAAVPHMRRQGGGRIIFFADTEAACGRPRHTGYLPYFVAKSGLIALGKSLALELAADRIFVNTLALGPILPADDTTDEDKEATARATPVGYWGGVEAVTESVRHLLQTSYVTGEMIRVDGGRHLA